MRSPGRLIGYASVSADVSDITTETTVLTASDVVVGDHPVRCVFSCNSGFSDGASGIAQFQIKRAGASVGIGGTILNNASTAGVRVPVTIEGVDFPDPGTYDYTVTLYDVGSTGDANISAGASASARLMLYSC